jgi:hypothetical protein
MNSSIYDDGRYVVSTTVVSTPSRIYPLANTTAGVRRDPLWMGLALAALVCGGIFTYGDLLYPVEIASALGVAALAVILGWQVAILRLDAPGHPRTMIVSSRARIWKIFGAIRSGKLAAIGPESFVIATD